MNEETQQSAAPQPDPAPARVDAAGSDFDVVVAGGGIAGLLTAARLAAKHPNGRIVLVEREHVLGGRLRLSSNDHDRHGYGLGGISEPLYTLWRQTLNDFGIDPHPSEHLPPKRQKTVAVLAGNRLMQQDIAQWFTAKGAKILGGMAAAKHWPEVEEMIRQGASAAPLDDDGDEIESEESESKASSKGEAKGRTYAVSHYWKQTRKAPAAIVLEHFASAFGIPDVWDADVEALGQRAAFHSGRLHCGDWREAVEALVEQPAFASAVTVVTGNRIVDAEFADHHWTITTEKGRYRAKALIVAQPPWQATAWLKRTFWPAHVLQVVSKTKPVSIVVLSEKLTSQAAGDLIPDVTLVPAEKVQIIRDGKDEVCFQATIDFELSLQAPAVVKAVKALKRARKKLLLLHPGAVTEGNFIALLPVAWAQSPQHSDRRWVERLGRKPFNSTSLSFCGDAYGSSYDGDANIIKSVANVCTSLDGAPVGPT